MVKTKKRTRMGARKVKDRWKAKEWYKIMAPDMFDRKQIGETLSADPRRLIGRTTEITGQDITGDFSKVHIKLSFQITDVKDDEAYTHFVGHDMTSDYVRRLTRRKHSKIDTTFNATTRDGYFLLVKPMAVADKRIQSSQQSAIRNIMKKVIQENALKKTMSEFLKDIISGELSRDLSNACKVIYPLKKVEIRKSEILKIGKSNVAG